MRLIPVVLVLALSAGCASAPTTPSSPAAAKSSVAPAANTAAFEANAAVAADAATPGAQAAGVPAQPAKVLNGYKTKVRDGETVYCKKIAKTGSRFEQETCMTASEMAQLEKQTEADRVMFRKNQTLCGTGGCGGT